MKSVRYFADHYAYTQPWWASWYKEQKAGEPIL